MNQQIHSHTTQVHTAQTGSQHLDVKDQSSIGMTALTGSLQGEKVDQRMNVISLVNEALANSQEELAEIMGASKREAMLKFNKKKGDHFGADALNRAKYFLNKLEQAGQSEKLSSFLDEVKKGGADAKNMLQGAKEQFSDVSDQFAALSYAKESLEAEGGE